MSQQDNDGDLMDQDSPSNTPTTPPTGTNSPTPPPAPPPSPATRPASITSRQTPQTLSLKILLMLLQNGLALTMHRPRPHTLAALNALRSDLVSNCPFFDPTHRPEELVEDGGTGSGRTGPTKFTEIVLLMARLMAVLGKVPGSGESERERRERVEVRRLCLALPFFDRAKLHVTGGLWDGGRGEGFEDEGVVV